jgi:hypothetical protein
MLRPATVAPAVLLLTSALLGAPPPARAQHLTPVPIQNPSFDQGVDGGGVPVGWQRYGGSPSATLAVAPEGSGLVLDDQDPSAEIGVMQTLPVTPSLGYEVAVKVRTFRGRTTTGAFVQLRFLPSQQYVQTGLATGATDAYDEVTMRGLAPADTTGARIYLYTHAAPVPKVMVTDVRVVSGVEPPPPPPPEPVVPVYERLKDMHLDIALVAGGEPACSIVAAVRYAEAAAVIQAAIARRTGVTVPIVPDTSPAAATPLTGNLIVLGNRSTSRTASDLYDRHYSLMDLKYPGPNGYAVRTLHDPYGNGFGAVLVGGSDDVGVTAGARAFGDYLAGLPASPGELAVGWTMLTRLGDGLTVPTDIRAFETWEASQGYGSIGYFGWNSISKRMATYYMTGDAFHAREVIRLSFPDAQAMREIEEIDGERIEDKRDPLAGPYHYNATMLILYWDLIEESPVFSDAERLAVTNAFARRLAHEQDRYTYALNDVPTGVSSRHGQWSALSLYTLGRYFEKYYPSPIWAHAVRAGELAFASLDRHAWVSGENDNLFWYNTAIAPTLTYLVLSGHRAPIDNGVLATLLRGQEVLISGRVPDWALNYAAIDYLHKAAYLTGDGRWITYRERTRLDTGIFRLGQSFWPDDTLAPVAPVDLVGRWQVNPMPAPMWIARGTGFDLDQSFQWMSYRSAPDAGGDYVLIDGYNGASRNPYHTYDILELRLGGRTLLDGYMNQVQTSADGMVEPLVPMDGQLLHRDVLGPIAVAVGQVPGMPYTNWRRTLVQRTGRYALVVDDLTFRADSANMRVSTTWHLVGGTWDAGRQAIRAQVPGWAIHLPLGLRTGVPSARATGVRTTAAIRNHNSAATHPGIRGDGTVTTNAASRRDDAAANNGAANNAGTNNAVANAITISYELHPSDVQETIGGNPVNVNWTGAVRTGDQRQAFYLLARGASNAAGAIECLQIAGNAATLALPAPAVAVAGKYAGISGDIVVLASDHLFGLSLTRAGLERALLVADAPVDVDWEFAAGTVHLVTSATTRLTFTADGAGARVDGEEGRLIQTGDTCTVDLGSGRHAITGLVPSDSRLRDGLTALVAAGRSRRAADLAAAVTPTPPSLPDLPAVARTELGAGVTRIEVLTGTEGPQVAVADEKVIHILGADGAVVRRLETDAKILSLRWWATYRILLAGCQDEKLIAFDESGARRWVFTSEMDPAVTEAGKTYWYKSAPGHEGVRGLFTGVFLNGEEQAFVGGACTLEIVDADGHLVARTPFFWGPGTVFQLVPKADGSIDLLIGREPGDGAYLWVYNNRTLVKRQSFYLVPPGFTYVGGWMDMARDHIFVADVTGDAAPEVVSEINGTWNRVTVWDLEGRPLHNAQFGPGSSTPARNMRDLDLVDLDGDGKKEIVAATSAGLVVALDGQCRRLWSTKLASPVTVLAALPAGDGEAVTIVVGAEDGSVLTMDAGGGITRRGKVGGAPTRIAAIDTATGRQVVLGTGRGEVAWFRQ